MTPTQLERQRQGSAILTSLPPVRTWIEVARTMHMTPARVQQLAYLAAWKIKHRMIAIVTST